MRYQMKDIYFWLWHRREFVERESKNIVRDGHGPLQTTIFVRFAGFQRNVRLK